MAWWIKDHVDAFAELMFFPWLCAFNIRWYEGPGSKAIIIDDGRNEELLTERAAANFGDDHRALYEGFPAFGS